MAIIICKNCGKKVSDTVDVCIHCGNNPKEENKNNVIEVSNEFAEVKTVEFDDLKEKEQLKLEAEFVKQDKWAKRYMLDVIELPSFGRLLYYPAIAIVILRILHRLTEVFATGELINEELSVIAAISGIGLVVLPLCTFFYSVVKRIYNRITQAHLIYLKKFQKWLMDNQNISYYPELKNLRQKATFESMNIE